MRLWSVHPKYLDTKGLLASWREALLAQKVLAGQTAGYRNHPQLQRFRATADQLASIGYFLEHVAQEADARSYNFNRALILHPGLNPSVTPMPVTRGQLAYEREHLLAKLALRDPERHTFLAADEQPMLHPLFTPVPGDIEDWERPSESCPQKI